MKSIIQRICEEKGINRSEFSRRSGISYPTLCVLEGGLVKKPRKNTIAKIAEFAGKAPEKLQEEYCEWKRTLQEAM